jgi:hypothetical protein
LGLGDLLVFCGGRHESFRLKILFRLGIHGIHLVCVLLLLVGYDGSIGLSNHVVGGRVELNGLNGGICSLVHDYKGESDKVIVFLQEVIVLPVANEAITLRGNVDTERGLCSIGVVQFALEVLTFVI